MRGDGVAHNHELLGLHCMRNLNNQNNIHKVALNLRGGVAHNCELRGFHCRRNFNNRNNILNLKEPHRDFLVQCWTIKSFAKIEIKKIPTSMAFHLATG